MAAKMPDKLKDLQLLFYVEAARHNVLPIDNSKTTRLDPAICPSLTCAGGSRSHSRKA